MFQQASNFTINGGQFTIAENGSRQDAGTNTVLINSVGRSDAGLVSTILWKHVAAGAIFDSAERYPAGKCHPQTRRRVIDQMTSWITDVNPARRIMWMYGPAGSGKSALMQSLCELLRDSYPELKGGSFFFAKGHIARGDADKLFVTLAYQLAIRFPAVRAAINDALTQDPSLPTKSMDIQLRSLIIDPLLRCEESPSITTPTVFIDGLDECDSDRTQRQIITLISKSVIVDDIPIRFIIASRPEYWIRDTFETSPLPDVTYTLSLRDDTDADRDIKAYLTDGFEKIRQDNKRTMQCVELPWPPEHVINRFVREASRQYIYVSTLLKFVGNHALFNDPQQQLEIILNSGPDRASAFTELDRLYKTVLSVYRRWEPMKRVLGGILMDVNLIAIRVLLGVPQAELTLVLDALGSLIDIYPPKPLSDSDQLLTPIFGSSLTDERILFCHLSLREFLLDKARSGLYHVDVDAIRGEAIRAFFAIIQGNLENNYEFEPHISLQISVSEYFRMMEAIIAFGTTESYDFRDLLPALNRMMERFRRFDPGRRMNYPACFIRDMDFLSRFLRNLESKSSMAAARNPDHNQLAYSDSMETFKAISNRLQKVASMARKIGIRLLSLCDGLSITHTLFFIRDLGHDYFQRVTVDALLTIPGTTVADTLSTIRQHCHIIKFPYNRRYERPNQTSFSTLPSRLPTSMSLVDLGERSEDAQIYWPDWENDPDRLIELKATVDEGWLSRKEWANQRVSLVSEFLKSLMTHLDNDWEHVCLQLTPAGVYNDLKYPIFAAFFNTGDISDIRGDEYFENEYNLSLMEVMVDSKAWMTLLPSRPMLWTHLVSVINPVLGWFDRQLTNSTAIRLMKEHDIFLPQKLVTAMNCVFQYCFIPIFKTPYFTVLVISSRKERKTIKMKGIQSNLLEEETAFIPPEDYFLFPVPTFLMRRDPPPPIPTSQWYPCLGDYLLNMVAKDLYRQTHSDFGHPRILPPSQSDRDFNPKNRQTDSLFIYLTQSFQYAQPTPQNLDTLRAIKYLSLQRGNKVFSFGPLPAFFSPAREFLKRYAPSALGSEELSDFEHWLQDIEESSSQ